jgi:hypothetical protein
MPQPLLANDFRPWHACDRDLRLSGNTPMTARQLAERLAEAFEPKILDQRIDAPIAWTRADLPTGDWLVPLPKAALAELESIAQRFAQHAGPLDSLALADMDAPATSALIVDVDRRVQAGVGFAVLDRLPTEGWSEAGAGVVAWLLCNAIAPAVRQKWNSDKRMYEVRDTGAKHGYGVRRSLTNLKQELHTDGPWLDATANFMGLVCVRQADEGGMSYVASLATVHNLLREQRPDLLRRLYHPFYWDRQAEHAPDQPRATWLPLFTWDGTELNARYYDDYIHSGYRLMKQELDAEGAEALTAMQAIVDAPETSFAFRLTPGQILFCNNHLVAHGRSAFTEKGATPRGRLMLRFWLRPFGGTGFEAAP